MLLRWILHGIYAQNDFFYFYEIFFYFPLKFLLEFYVPE